MIAQSPTDALPGSRKKLEILRARAEANVDLFVEGDVARFPELTGARDFDAFVDYCRKIADVHQQVAPEREPHIKQHRVRMQPLAVRYGFEKPGDSVHKGGRPTVAVPDHID